MTRLDPSEGATPRPRRIIGRYELLGEIGSGGMALVHLGRIHGSVGFSRNVAVKELHPHLLKETEFVEMFMDEARIAATVQHQNVVTTLDVIVDEHGCVFQVMEFVEGDSLARLLRRTRRAGDLLPLDVVGALMVGVLDGLHAAHESRDGEGELVNLVHRDVSPHNVIVGKDGTPRVHDFGVAKASVRVNATRGDCIKGRLSFMAPETLSAPAKVDRRADIYSAGLMLWEMLVGRRLRKADSQGAMYNLILTNEVPPPTELRPDLPPEVDALIARACATEPEDRFATAAELSDAIHDVLGRARHRAIAAQLNTYLGKELEHRAGVLARIDAAEGSDSLRRVRLESLRFQTRRELMASMRLDRVATDEEPPSPPQLVTAVAPRRKSSALFVAVGMLFGIAALLVVRGCTRTSIAVAEAHDARDIVGEVAPTPTVDVPVTDERSSNHVGAKHEPAGPARIPVAHAEDHPRSNATAEPAPASPPANNSPRGTRPPVDCSPPYFLTADGTRRYKAECL